LESFDYYTSLSLASQQMRIFATDDDDREKRSRRYLNRLVSAHQAIVKVYNAHFASDGR